MPQTCKNPNCNGYIYERYKVNPTDKMEIEIDANRNVYTAKGEYFWLECGKCGYQDKGKEK